MDVAALTRPRTGEFVNGDAYFIHQNDSIQLYSVIDGLGHGLEANIASQKAMDILKENVDKELNTLFSTIHRGLFRTRGVVAAVMRFHNVDKTMEYMGLGNIDMHSTNRKIKPISIGGILGHNWRNPKYFSYEYNHGDLFVMFSDGISSRFDLDLIRDKSCKSVAETILKNHGKVYDDATVLVVRT